MRHLWATVDCLFKLWAAGSIRTLLFLVLETSLSGSGYPVPQYFFLDNLGSPAPLWRVAILGSTQNHPSIRVLLPEPQGTFCDRPVRGAPLFFQQKSALVSITLPNRHKKWNKIVFLTTVSNFYALACVYNCEEWKPDGPSKLLLAPTPKHHLLYRVYTTKHL